MTIKELEEKLGIPRATIRYYEKEKLIAPKRNDNSYRDYTEEDIKRLKEIIIFRKIGFSVSEVADILSGRITLQEALSTNIRQLEKSVDELNGAIYLCSQMLQEKETAEAFDTELYWNRMQKEEKSGKSFLDITKDVLAYEQKELQEALSVRDYDGNKRYTRPQNVAWLLALLAAGGAVGGLTGELCLLSVLRGMMIPVVFILVFAVVSLAFYPKRKDGAESPKRKRIPLVAAVLISFIYMLSLFWGPVRDIVLAVLSEADGDEYMLGIMAVGVLLSLWSFIYRICELTLVFDRRHVTGFSSFTACCWGIALGAMGLYGMSWKYALAYVLSVMIIYNTIQYFISEKPYSPDERYKKPGQE